MNESIVSQGEEFIAADVDVVIEANITFAVDAAAADLALAAAVEYERQRQFFHFVVLGIVGTAVNVLGEANDELGPSGK